jgi:hypothetical protein
MLQRIKTIVGLGLFALSVGTECICKSDPPQVETIKIDAAAVQQDSRLDKVVTLSGRSITLKEAFAAFSSQTGVAISIDDRSYASNYPLTIECRQTPVFRMMDAVYGLLSLRKAEWAWVWVNGVHGYSYDLRETPWSKDRMNIYKTILAVMPREYMDLLRQLTPMTMAERKLHRSAVKETLHAADDGSVDVFFNDEKVWKQAEFFFTGLLPDQQDDVLRGEPVRLSPKSLSPELAELFAQAVPLEQGQAVPETVTFMLSKPLGRASDLAPRINMSYIGMSGTWMGTGELHNGMRSAMNSVWMLPGDTANDPAADRVVQQAPLTADAQHEVEQAKQQAAWFESTTRLEMDDNVKRRVIASITSSVSLLTVLEQLSDGANVPLIALLEDHEQNSLGYASPVGKSVQQTLDRIRARWQNKMVKWRSGVLVINDLFWFADP